MLVFIAVQVTLRSLRDHSFYPDFVNFNIGIGPLDVYQGFRLLAKLTKLAAHHLRRTKNTLIVAALKIATDIQANGSLSKNEMYEYFASLDSHILALQLGGTSDVERDIMEHVYDIFCAHPMPIVNNIVQEAEIKGPTIVAFRDAVCKIMLNRC